MNKSLIRSIIFLVGLTAIVSCGQQASQPAAIPVGSILGLTGDNASYGQKMQQGFEMAIEEINSAGGIEGRPIALKIEDSQFDPAKAISAYRKLTGADEVRVIVGITGSKNAIPVAEAAKADPVVIIDALSSAPKLTTVAGPNYFRIMASDALAGKYNADWALQDGMKKPFIVYVEDDWGVSYRDSLLQYLQSKGISQVPSQGVTASTRDFRAQVEKIRQSAPDTIFLLVYAKEGSAFMQQLRQAGIGAQVYGSDNISTPEFASVGNDVVEGVRVALPAEANGAAYDAFAARYKAKYTDAPDANVIKSYDAMKLAAHTIAEVGEDPARIREHLRSPQFQYTGISGDIKFDEHGDLVGQQYTRMVYRSGALTPLQ